MLKKEKQGTLKQGYSASFPAQRARLECAGRFFLAECCVYAEKEVPLQRKTQSSLFMANGVSDIPATKDSGVSNISATKDSGVMDISVIIPLFNEEESLKKLYEWITRVCAQEKLSFEVVFVDDGSTDGSWHVVEELKQSAPDHVRGIRFRRNYGKSAALYCGFRAAQGDVVITMDADLQDSPDEIPELVRMIREEGYDLVSGWKKKRYDNALTKNLPSKLFNATARRVTGLKLHDMNCGLKAYRQEVVKNIEVFSEMHRYIPYLAKNAGFTKIGEKVVQHRKREFGVSKFGLNRFVNGYLDLLTLWFLNKFGKQPMHFFGLIGSLMFFLGFVAIVVVGGMKLYALHHGVHAMLVGTNPYFHLSILMMVLGCMLFLAGFLGELIIRNSQSRNDYLIREEL